MTHEEKMIETIKLAKVALEHGELPISAIIYHGDSIISQAYTSEKQDKRFLVHAEFKALLEADLQKYSIKQRKEMQLFTTLEPCMMCLGAAMTFFIGEIVYALESPSDGAINHVLNHWKQDCEEIPSYKIPEITSGLMRKESIALFREYAKINIGKPMYAFAKSLADLGGVNYDVRRIKNLS